MSRRQLLETQTQLREIGPEQFRSIELITMDELQQIRRLWRFEKHEFDESEEEALAAKQAEDEIPKAADKSNERSLAIVQRELFEEEAVQLAVGERLA